jgi:rod shape-determining protein MreC
METRRGTSLLVVLILVHLVAISHQVDSGGGSMLERSIFAVITPIQRIVSAAVHGVTSTWRGYVDLRGVREENARLRERVGFLERTLQQKQHLAREAERLRGVLELQRTLPIETTVAQVLAREGVPWFRTFTINKGSRQGVLLNAPVLSPTGVVGRVIGLGPYAAKVQLLLDRDSAVGVLFTRTRVTGVTSGQAGLADSGSRELVVNYVQSLADVVLGDEVVTSGLDQIFPKGLTVGRVVRIGAGTGLFKEIYVAPSVHFDELEEVLVVKPAPTRPLELTESVQ